MKEDCGCCEGTEQLTPQERANRPGLDALAYRAGTHAAFLETMKARLSAHRFELQLPSGETRTSRPLLALKTRAGTDAAVAVLDAWATVADVLTFYQERIANEGFLRTATERRSVVELARLVGYRPRPGVAASVYLAYTLEADSPEVEIPAGNRVQSVPGPGEKAQTFETAEPLKARPAWNLLTPRATRPQDFRIAFGRIILPENDTVYLKGTATRLAVNDPLLVIVGRLRTVFRVVSVEPDAAADRTAVRLVEWTQIPETLPTTTQELWGEVVRANNDDPVLRATVTLTSAATSAPMTAETNIKGIFRFAGIAAGTYTLTVTAAGFRNFGPVSHVVTAGQRLYAGIIRLEPLPAASGSMSGRVVDHNGAPMSDVTVTVFGVTSQASAQTDSTGYFFITRLRPGVYTLDAAAPGFVTAHRTNLHVLSAQTLPVGDIMLIGPHQPPPPGGDVRGSDIRGVAGGSEMRGVEAVVERHLDLESAGVSPTTATARTVVGQLEGLRNMLGPEADAAAVRETLDREVLPELRKVRDRATTRRSATLSAWLDTIVSELEAAARGGSEPMAGGEASAGSEPSADDLFAEDSPPADDANFDEDAEAKLRGPSSGPRQVMPPRAASGENVRAPRSGEPAVSGVEIIEALTEQLTAPPSQPPSSSRDLPRDPGEVFGPRSDVAVRALAAFNPALGSLLYAALASAPVNPGRAVEVYALRAQAGLFGATAPLEPRFEPATLPPSGDAGAPTPNPRAGQPLPQSQLPEWTPAPDEAGDLLYLDNVYDKILPQTYAVVLRPDRALPEVFTATDARKLSRNAYGVSATVTTLRLDDDWWRPHRVASPPAEGEPFRLIRRTSVFAQAEPLPLAEEPVTENICGQRLTLDAVYEGLEAGRWLIITGERTDVRYKRKETEPALTKTLQDVRPSSPARASDVKRAADLTGESETDEDEGEPVTGLPASELVMLSGVEHGYDPERPGDPVRTTVVLSSELAYCYRRGTVKIYGNVVRATHGETREEILGSGDASRRVQSFALRESPLTYVSAATPSGVESTLRVRVNDLLWRETESLARLGPNDRGYATRAAEEDKTTVAFGNGERGARPSTGVENVRAVYRTGIGRGGNVAAGRISSVVTKPLGVRGVVNPMPATGGADREGRDEVRRHAPLAVLALDRLVSLSDYEDFARTFAGVGKASAARLSDGLRQIVHLTVAGADDIPIAPTSDLFRNLGRSLRAFGDPFLPVRLATRELLLLFIRAAVAVRPEYLWEKVEPKVRRALLERFSFARRELGEDVTLSEVVAAIQSVEGVAYVDVDALDAATEQQFKSFFGSRADIPTQYDERAQRVRVFTARLDPSAADERSRIRPAQLALLSPSLADALILSEIKA